MTHPDQGGQNMPAPNEWNPQQGWQGQAGWQGQQAWQGQQGWQGPPGGQPPGGGQRRTKTVAIAVVGVVLVLAALGITGFVAPGFFLGDDADADDGNGGAEAAFTSLVTALRNKDSAALTNLACPDADGDVSSATGSIAQVNVTGEAGALRMVSDTEAVGELQIMNRPFALTLHNKDGRWCWYDIEPKSSDATASPPSADDVPDGGPEPAPAPSSGNLGDRLKEFLSAINQGNAAAIKELSCGKFDENHRSIEPLLSGTPSLVIGPNVRQTDDLADARFTGVGQDGDSIAGLVGGRVNSDDQWCIDTFSWS